MTGNHYTNEDKRKAAAMVQNGISRNKTAVILGIAKSTLWRWGTPAFPPTKPPLLQKSLGKVMRRQSRSTETATYLHAH